MYHCTNMTLELKKNVIRKISSRNIPTQFDDVAGIQFWFFIVSRRNKNLS